MTTEQTTNLIEWFKKILLAFEKFFHAVQAWIEGDIMEQDWFKNLTETTTGEAEGE